MRKILLGLAATAMLLAPSLALAAEGFATANVNMRSGPSTRYPAVTVIPVDTEIEIHGCLSDVPWCDVSFYQGRGWVAAQYIATEYRQNRVYLQPQYYRPLGIPTITFDLGNYWERNYRNRDFYRDRERWGRSDYDGNRRERRRTVDQYDNDRPRQNFRNDDNDGYNQDFDRRQRRERDRDRRRVIEENNNFDQFENDNANDNRRRREENRRNENRREENRREENRRNDNRNDNDQNVNRNRDNRQNDNRQDNRRRQTQEDPITCQKGDIACAVRKSQ